MDDIKKDETAPEWGGARDNAGAPMKYDPVDVIEAIRKGGGYVSAAARHLGCSTQTIYNYIDRFPEVADAKRDIEERQLDTAEIALLDAIAKSELTAIIFYLKTKGKRRGYVERQEVAGTGSQGEIVIFQIPDNGRDPHLPPPSI